MTCKAGDNSLSISSPNCTAFGAGLYRHLSKGNYVCMGLLRVFLITCAAAFVIKIINQYNPIGTGWFLAPASLIAFALLVNLVTKKPLKNLGFNITKPARSVTLACLALGLTIPLAIGFMLLLRSGGIALPLRPIIQENQNIISWIFYQFMYIAVAEEVFFRGYVLTELQAGLCGFFPRKPYLQTLLAVLISSCLFALGHFIVQGQIISLLTFLPGLILGWLFVRTNSLLAPVLYHGLANTAYLLAGMAITATPLP